MALVDLLASAPQPAMTEKPALEELRRAAAPGKVRDLVVDLFLSARLQPGRAGGVLSGAQRTLRTLRSRQRRWVLNALYDLVRYEAALELLLGTSDGDALWVGGLVRLGLDPDEAAQLSGLDVDFSRCARFETALDEAVAPLGPVARVAAVSGLSATVASQLVEAWGPEQALAFVAASNQRAPVVLRANRTRVARDELVETLRAEGIACEPGRWSPHAVVLHSRANLQALSAFKQGKFEVQDEGSQLLAALVEPEGLVVDLCAGAGGKTLALAAAGAGRLVATDVRERPLQELHKRAARAGARVEVHRLDRGGGLPRAVSRLRADRVLVDAPCSGTGVLRRHPEHRWLVDDSSLRRTTALQREILDRAVALVKPGGRLIYGTCSVLPIENRGVVGAFLARHPDFLLRSARAALGAEHGDFLEVAPHTHGTDGFFGAVFERS